MTASGGGVGGGSATLAIATTVYLTASGGGVGGGSATLAIATTVYLTASGGGVGGGVASLIRIRLTLYSASQNKQCLVAVGNDQVWMEDTSVANGTMVQIAASIGDVDTTDNLSMFAAYGKAVILNGAKLKIADFSNAKITTASIGTNPPDFETVLTGATSGASMAVDYLSSLSGAAIIRGKRTTTALFSSGETVTGIDDDGNAISFVTDSAESDGLKWYNYITFGNSVSFGSLPSKAYIGCLHLGRIFLSGNPDFPNQWYASRQGNMWDWLYNQEDAQSACTGADVEMGAVQDIIRALISYDNDYLLFGCHGSIYALLGDPMQGGSMKRVSDKVGVFESRSWCFDEDRNLYFVGPGGLYRIAKGLTGIENLTQFSLPSLIHEEQVDPSTHRILLAFDTKRHGILVSIVTISTSANSCYWYDIRAGSFMPESYPAQCAAYSMEYYDSVVIDQRELLIGSTDGYIRRFDETKKDDDIGALDSAIDSYVTFGPFPMGETPADDGIVGCVYGVMAGTGSSSVTYYTYVGDSPEDVMNKVTADTYSVSGLVQATGLQRGAKQRRMARGKWGAIRLRSNTAGQTWGMEAIEVDIYPAGRLA
jgi:hypothetical protein